VLPLLLRRNPASSTATRHYETNGWFYVADSITNLARNRYVLTMPMLGLPVRCTAGSTGLLQLLDVALIQTRHVAHIVKAAAVGCTAHAATAGNC
jgi:hypothetical protein